MTSGGLQAFHNGEKVVIAGLALLAASFGLFVAIALVFDYRMRKTPTDRGSQLNWKRELIILYLASFLILLRSVFRLVEYSQGNKGYLITQEWTLFVFDSILMFAALVLFNVWHPSHVKALLDGGKYSQKCGMKYVDIQAEKSQFGDQEQMRGL